MDLGSHCSALVPQGRKYIARMFGQHSGSLRSPMKAIMLVPNRHIAAVLSRAYKQTYLFRSYKETSIRDQVRYWTCCALEGGTTRNRQQYFSLLVKTCELWWAPSPESPNSELTPLPREATEDVLKGAVQLDDLSFFEQAASRHQGKLSYDFFPCLREWLDASYTEKGEGVWLSQLGRFESG